MSYLGQSPGQGQAERFIFTASGGETSVTLDDAGRGVAYTVGQVDVYLNGVKLVNGTDFTATSGSSITGLSALTASDVVEIVALDAFSPADTVSASTGGTFNDAVTITDSANNPLTLNRTTSDGDIQVFKKDGTTVGSIGNSGSTAIYVGSGDTNLLFKADEDDIVPFSAGGYRDAAVDLGRSNARFKDLYLSGGVYLGGTGAANYLDDYEEGYFNASVVGSTSGSATISAATSRFWYSKIGDRVFVSGSFNVTGSTTVGTWRLSLPFVCKGDSAGAGYTSFVLPTYAVNKGDADNIAGLTIPNQSYIQIAKENDNAGRTDINTTGYYYINFNYPTSA